MAVMALGGRHRAGRSRSASRALWAMGMHLGLLTVCAAAVFTGWQRTIVSLPQWGAMLLVAVGLAVMSLWGGGRHLGRTPTRLLLTLGGLMVLGLGYDPQLAAIPGLGAHLPETLLSAQPSISMIGAVVLLVAWFGYVSAGGEDGVHWPQFRVAALAASGLTLAVIVFNYLLLHSVMDLPAAEALRPALSLAQAGALSVVLAGTSGGPGIRMAPHLYLSLALILAFARNLVFPME